jgi:putative nucleotidyltransferase with HDIG domain
MAPRDIDTLLDELITLPSLPTVVTRVTTLLDDPNASLADVGRAVGTDPSLALKTLRLVNSAFYGVREKVTSVEQAVPLLGAKVIQNLVLTATVFDSLASGADRLMHHSISVGVMMRVLAQEEYAGGLTAEEAFVYGLLHDVGKIILEEYLPEDYAQVRQLCIDQSLPSHAGERAIIGVDHAEIGARLAERWKLSDELVDAIAGHHELPRCQNPDHRSLAGALSAADYICTAAGLGGEAAIHPAITPAAWAAAGITSADVPHVLESFFESLPAIGEMYEAAS